MADVLTHIDTLDVEVAGQEELDITVGSPMEHSRVLPITKNGKHVVSDYDLANVDVQPSLTDLTVTKNGSYLPKDYDADGFSKVDVNTDIPPFVSPLSDGSITSTVSMFGYSKATKLDLRGLDVSNVTNMSRMFTESSVRELNIDGWDTSKVIDMSRMFYGAQIEHLDLSHFDTSACKSMTSMFWATYPNDAIDREIDAHYLNTSACTNMNGMFNGNYTRLDVRGFDTSNVTTFSSMFRYNLWDTIDLTSFRTTSCTNFATMFQYCRFTTIDLTNFDCSNAVYVTNMFQFCSNAVSLCGDRTLDEITRGNISILNGLKLSIDVSGSGFTKLNVQSMVALFNGVADLTGQASKTITVGKTNLAKLTPEQIAIATTKNWNII